MELQIGHEVKRLGSVKDYTTGRIGKVIALDNSENRAQVNWTHRTTYYSDGEMVKIEIQPIKTWVRYRDLEILSNA